MTPFVKQKARKAIYRRIRGQAFEDSWGAQLQLKKQKEAEEKEAEKKRQQLIRESRRPKTIEEIAATIRDRVEALL